VKDDVRLAVYISRVNARRLDLLEEATGDSRQDHVNQAIAMWTFLTREVHLGRKQLLIHDPGTRQIRKVKQWQQDESHS
jgi:hypothetical protein